MRNTPFTSGCTARGVESLGDDVSVMGPRSRRDKDNDRRREDVIEKLVGEWGGVNDRRGWLPACLPASVFVLWILGERCRAATAADTCSCWGVGQSFRRPLAGLDRQRGQCPKMT